MWRAWLLGLFFTAMVGVSLGLGWLYANRSRWVELAKLAGKLTAAHGFGAAGEASRIRQRLIQAGYRSPEAVGIYLLVRYGGGAAALFLLAGQSLMGAISAAAAVMLVPNLFLNLRVCARASAIRSGLAPALDLVILALEAGHSLDYALAGAAAALKPLCAELSGELALCNAERRAGASRTEALRRMGERVPEEEVRRLVGVLIDAERFGASLVPTLRTHLHYLRLRMRQHAQTHARRLSVRLVFPIFFLIFPAILLITLGPAYLQLSGLLTMLAR